jgi:hypothetical protein
MKIVHIFGPQKGLEKEVLWAGALYELLFKLAEKQQPEASLQNLFKPLDNRQTNLTVLQLSKGGIKSKSRNNPKLRIYVVRIGGNTYVVTGGAIKLTHQMADRPHTQEQLSRLTLVRDWLKRENIYYPDDLINLS